MALTVENPDASPKDKIRMIQFHTKASCENDPIYYRIDGYDSTLKLVEVEEPAPQYTYKSSGKKGKKDADAPQVKIPYKESEVTPF